jgi:hypothetical protein
MARCRYCPADVSFIRTPAGKLVPVEPEIVTVVTTEGAIVKGHSPHWEARKR